MKKIYAEMYNLCEAIDLFLKEDEWKEFISKMNRDYLSASVKGLFSAKAL